ncbi:MAG: TIGR01777 family oxidoreductase [Bradymonadaceae bacterium]
MSDDTGRIAITGSSGLIGSHLRHLLDGSEWAISRVVRDRSDAGDGDVYWRPTAGEIDADALEGVDAVVHLAGESIFGRWTDSKKESIRVSRAQGTTLLAETLADLDDPPDVLFSASAVGYYGDRGEERLDESADSGSGFLADVCREWEASTRAAADAGIRTVVGRFGLVLSSEGGALATMLPAFQFGLGGRLGSGEQYMSWIHIDDLVRGIEFAVECEQLEGPVNYTAPEPVKNSEFTDILGGVLGRPTILPVPEFAARLALGEMADEALLSGQRVLPDKLLDAGFEFQFEALRDALEHEVG